jgi:hypothetical protein
MEGLLTGKLRRCDTARAVVTATLLATGLLSGCARNSPAPPDTSLSEAAVDIATQSGAYPDQMERVSLAENKLIERCMRGAGFTWSGAARRPARPSDAEVLANARRNGYGMSAAGSPSAPPGTADDGPRIRAALLGPDDDLARLVIDGRAAYWFPRTGCAAQAHIAVYGTLDDWARVSYVPPEIDLILGEQAESDDLYQAALGQWRTCMATHHHTYASPAAVPTELAAKYRTDDEPLAQRRAREITIAVDDATCAQQVGLTATRNALRRQHAQQLSSPQRAELARLADLFTQARRRTSA